MRRTGAQDKAFAVLAGGHQARIDRHIGVNLDAADAQAEGFEELQPIWSEAGFFLFFFFCTRGEHEFDYGPGLSTRQ